MAHDGVSSKGGPASVASNVISAWEPGGTGWMIVGAEGIWMGLFYLDAHSEQGEATPERAAPRRLVGGGKIPPALFSNSREVGRVPQADPATVAQRRVCPSRYGNYRNVVFKP